MGFCKSNLTNTGKHTNSVFLKVYLILSSIATIIELSLRKCCQDWDIPHVRFSTHNTLLITGHYDTSETGIRIFCCNAFKSSTSDYRHNQETEFIKTKKTKIIKYNEYHSFFSPQTRIHNVLSIKLIFHNFFAFNLFKLFSLRNDFCKEKTDELIDVQSTSIAVPM